MTSKVRIGTRAPGFTLWTVNGTGTERTEVSLDDFLDRWLVLLFYPRDFSLICPTELTAVSRRMAEFRQRSCDILGVSTDPVETHERWLTVPPSQGGLGTLQFPLASDPDGTVCRKYGVYVDRQHLALRGLFIIDPNGVLQYQVVHSLSVGRSSEEVVRVLEALQSGGLCPGEPGLGAPTMDVLSELGPNRVIGQFQIEETIGSGAFGTVFRAHDQLLDRTVALKILQQSDSVHTEKLLAEARAAAALSHPNVCMVYAIDTSHGAAMIVMEYVAGEPLAAQIKSGPLPPEFVTQVGRQVAEGMAAAHEAGVVHGDLKPGNLMITSSSSVKIMDFGLARRFASVPRQAETIEISGSSSSGMSGTPGYMAPEQTRGEPATPATDVFAIGLIIYEMLTGQPAITGNNIIEVLNRSEQFEPADYASRVPEPFAGVLRESLVRNPFDRRITMSEIAERLSNS